MISIVSSYHHIHMNTATLPVCKRSAAPPSMSLSKRLTVPTRSAISKHSTVPKCPNSLFSPEEEAMFANLIKKEEASVKGAKKRLDRKRKNMGPWERAAFNLRNHIKAERKDELIKGTKQSREYDCFGNLTPALQPPTDGCFRNPSAIDQGHWMWRTPSS